MAEMPPLFYPPFDVILPHNPMGYAAPQKFLLPTMAARSIHDGYSD